jgi:hypothetical protein
MRLFLDTEWADENGRELVSLALVSEDATHVFYGERDSLPGWPTDWVSWVVYPRLCRGCCTLSDPLFTTKLRKFLRDVESPVVLFDADNDLALLELALADFGRPGIAQDEPVCFGVRKLTGRSYEDAIQAVWKIPDANKGRHNALVDAFAMRQAFMSLKPGEASPENGDSLKTYSDWRGITPHGHETCPQCGRNERISRDHPQGLELGCRYCDFVQVLSANESTVRRMFATCRAGGRE